MYIPSRSLNTAEFRASPSLDEHCIYDPPVVGVRPVHSRPIYISIGIASHCTNAAYPRRSATVCRSGGRSTIWRDSALVVIPCHYTIFSQPCPSHDHSTMRYPCDGWVVNPRFTLLVRMDGPGVGRAGGVGGIGGVGGDGRVGGHVIVFGRKMDWIGIVFYLWE